MAGIHNKAADTVNPRCYQFIHACSGKLKNFEIGAISKLTDMLVQFNLWNKFIAIYPFVGGESSTSSLNLKDVNNFKITWRNSLIFNSNGVIGNGGYGETNIPLKNLNLSNMHISAYNKTPFSQINGTGRFIGVNTLELIDSVDGWGAQELNFNKNSGIVGYVYNKINFLGGYGFLASEMIDQNISGTGLMVGINSYECYVNNRLFGYRFPLLPTEIHPNTPRKLILFGNNYDGKVSSTINANLSFASVGSSFTVKEVELFNIAVESFQRLMLRSAL